MNPWAALQAAEYSMDASRAEEVLSGLVRPRIYEEEWLKIVRDKKNENYKVRSGDTLWDISGKKFGDAFLWRKLWQVNSTIGNPHSLNKGQSIKFYSDEPGVPTVHVALVKLRPSRSLASLEGTSEVAGVAVVARYVPVLQMVQEEEFLGELTGAYSPSVGFRELSEPYFEAKQGQYNVGDMYSVVRFEDHLDRVSLPDGSGSAKLMRLVADVQVIGMKDSKIKTQTRKLYDVPRRGDYLVSLRPAAIQTEKLNPPEQLETRVLAGERESTVGFGQGEIVLLDKGASDGMKPGFVFRAITEEDPLTEDSDDVSSNFNAEIQVVQTHAATSLGFVLRNNEVLRPGKLLVPRQRFSEPPEVTFRRVTVLELD